MLLPESPTAPDEAVNVIGFSLLEANNGLQQFQPSWFNVWEASLFKKAQRKSGYTQWLFNRFGFDQDPGVHAGDRLRNADYRDCLRAMTMACKQAMDSVDRKNALLIRRERTALIYFDSWGETSLFEGVTSWRDSLSLDMLPRSIARDYAVKDFSCKLRGEHNGFLMGLRVAIDRLNSGGIDTVLLCGQFRSFPVLVLSQAALATSQQRDRTPTDQRRSHISVERAGCVILRKAPQQGIALHLADYVLLADKPDTAVDQLASRWRATLTDNCAGILGGTHTSKKLQSIEKQALSRLASPPPFLSLTTDFGDSGCLNPMLALQHLRVSHRPEDYLDRQILVNAMDGQGAAWLMECWPHEVKP